MKKETNRDAPRAASSPNAIERIGQHLISKDSQAKLLETKITCRTTRVHPAWLREVGGRAASRVIAGRSCSGGVTYSTEELIVGLQKGSKRPTLAARTNR